MIKKTLKAPRKGRPLLSTADKAFRSYNRALVKYKSLTSAGNAHIRLYKREDWPPGKTFDLGRPPVTPAQAMKSAENKLKVEQRKAKKYLPPGEHPTDYELFLLECKKASSSFREYVDKILPERGAVGKPKVGPVEKLMKELRRRQGKLKEFQDMPASEFKDKKEPGDKGRPARNKTQTIGDWKEKVAEIKTQIANEREKLSEIENLKIDMHALRNERRNVNMSSLTKSKKAIALKNVDARISALQRKIDRIEPPLIKRKPGRPSALSLDQKEIELIKKERELAKREAEITDREKGQPQMGRVVLFSDISDRGKDNDTKKRRKLA